MLCVFVMCDCDLCVVVFEWLRVCGCYVCDVSCVVRVWLCLFGVSHSVCCRYSHKCDLCVNEEYLLCCDGCVPL